MKGAIRNMGHDFMRDLPTAHLNEVNEHQKLYIRHIDI
jgi:hypothetical protein